MAKTVLAELVAVFKGDTGPLEKSIEGANKSIASFAKTTAFAAGAAASALGALALKQINIIGQNNDLAKSLGISYSALQNMSLVANEAGVGIEKVGAALGIMQRNIADAISGSDVAAGSISKLGLSAQQLFNLSPDEQFALIAQKISEIENPAERTAAAMDIFGRSGRELIAVFEGYSAKAAEAKKFNDEFNLSLSQMEVEKVDAAGDAMGRLSLILQGLGNKIAVEVSPAVIDLANYLTEAALGAKILLDRLAKTRGQDKGYTEVIFPLDLPKKTKELSEYDAIMSRLQSRVQKTGIPITSTSSKTTTSKLGGGSSPFLVTGEGADDAKKAITSLNKELDNTRQKTEEIRNSAADTFSGFVSSVGRGESAMQSLRTTALNAIQDIINNMFRLSFGGTTSGGMGGSIASSIFSMLDIGSSGSANTALRGALTPKPFANGGVVSGASLFNIGGRSAQMGEKGPEAIMPLVRGAGGKLGVASAGGSGKSVVQNINISTGVSQTVRAEISRLMPQIMQAAVGSVQNAQNRNMLKGGAQ